MVAALGNLQIGIMPRRQLDTLRRHQIDQRIMIDAWRHDLVHRTYYPLVLLRTGHRQHTGVHVTDHVFIYAHASGDDYPPVFRDGFADRIE